VLDGLEGEAELVPPGALAARGDDEECGELGRVAGAFVVDGGTLGTGGLTLGPGAVGRTLGGNPARRLGGGCCTPGGSGAPDGGTTAGGIGL
jgi:hypothetical protein